MFSEHLQAGLLYIYIYIYVCVNVLINIVCPKKIGMDTSFVLLLSILTEIWTRFNIVLMAVPNLHIWGI